MGGCDKMMGKVGGRMTFARIVARLAPQCYGLGLRASRDDDDREQRQRLSRQPPQARRNSAANDCYWTSAASFQPPSASRLIWAAVRPRVVGGPSFSQII
jgi:hypothetical protein